MNIASCDKKNIKHVPMIFKIIMIKTENVASHLLKQSEIFCIIISNAFLSNTCQSTTFRISAFFYFDKTQIAISFILKQNIKMLLVSERKKEKNEKWYTSFSVL